MTQLKISIDPGSSATKVAYQLEGGDVKCFSMSPYCAEVPLDFLTHSRLGMGIPHIESSWVTYPEGCFMLGEGAKKFHGSEVRNGDRKFEKALYKIFGILAHIQLVEEAECEVKLGVLLPFDEYSTKQTLERQLRYLSDCIDYCGQSLSIEFKQIQICPEGAGLFLSGLPNTIDLQGARVGVLVIGHRNASWLVTENGAPVIEESVTNNLGFRWLVEEVRSRTGHKDEIALAEMIFSQGVLSPQLQEAIDDLLPFYWNQIQSFLDEQRPTHFVVCGGGAALLLKEKITEHLSSKVSWANHLSRHLSKSGVKDKVMARRLTDCYGLLLSLGETP